MITKYICKLTFLIGQRRVLMDFEKEECEIGIEEIDVEVQGDISHA